MTLECLIDELEKQRPLKWDQRINTSELEMVVIEDKIGFQIKGKESSFLITKPCQEQIAEKLGIPFKYYQKMEAQAPILLAQNVNTWLKRLKKEFFLRGLGNRVRAFLSERYRVIDHLDVIYCSLNELQAHGAEIEDCFLSETEMNIKVKSKRLVDFVRHKGDLIIGGLLLINSETGQRALRVEPRLFRVKCKNGLVIEEFLTRAIHLGDGEADEIVYLSLRRSIRELFSHFGKIVEMLREKTEIKVKEPKKVIKNLVEHYRLTEAQKENILLAFGAEPLADQFGIANALGRAAKLEETWEKALELERLSGRVLTLSLSEFKNLDG
jgi:hypothetical protein